MALQGSRLHGCGCFVGVHFVAAYPQHLALNGSRLHAFDCFLGTPVLITSYLHNLTLKGSKLHACKLFCWLLFCRSFAMRSGLEWFQLACLRLLCWHTRFVTINRRNLTPSCLPAQFRASSLESMARMGSQARVLP